MPERLDAHGRIFSPRRTQALLAAVLALVCAQAAAVSARQQPPPQPSPQPSPQPAAPTQRQPPAPPPDALRLTVVYRLPEMDKVEVRRDLTYKTVGGVELKMDVYTPPGAKAGTRLPVVIFVNGVGDPPGRPKLKEWGQYTAWPRLIAASGMAAVTYEARPNEVGPDTEDLVKHVRASAAALGVDADRVALWSCSANVLLALPFTMDAAREYLRAAVFYYGFMNERPSRADVPLFVARAGYDNPRLNGSIDEFVKAALADDVPLTFVSYVYGQHGFELLDDNERSREVVRQTIDFLRFNLTRDFEAEARARRALTPPKFLALIQKHGVEHALREFEAARKAEPGGLLFQEVTINNLGYQLIRQRRTKEAVAVLKLNVSAHPQSANAYDSLSDAYEADGDRELALQYAEKALQALAGDAALNDTQRQAIRQSAEDKLKRLKGQ